MGETLQAEQLKSGTKAFAIRIVKFIRTFPQTDEGRIPGKQLLRSGTSIAANYRAVRRARSKADFISKMGVVVEQADETVFWIEMVQELGLRESSKTDLLLTEANELLAIFAASQHTAKPNASRR